MALRSSGLHGYGIRLTPKFSCKHAKTIATKPHPKSACQLQRSLDGRRELLELTTVIGLYRQDRARIRSGSVVTARRDRRAMPWRSGWP